MILSPQVVLYPYFLRLQNGHHHLIQIQHMTFLDFWYRVRFTFERRKDKVRIALEQEVLPALFTFRRRHFLSFLATSRLMTSFHLLSRQVMFTINSEPPPIKAVSIFHA